MLPPLFTGASHFSKLLLTGFELDGDASLQLDVDMEEGFQLELLSCSASPEGTRVLLDLIRRNRGPTSLNSCYYIDTVTLADALRGNTSVTELHLWRGHNENNTIASLRALGDNVGLTKLTLSYLNDEVWTEMCQSLGGHPSIKLLNVRYTASRDESSIRAAGGKLDRIMSGARRTLRTQALVDMLRVNTVMETIDYSPEEMDMPLFENQVAPPPRDEPTQAPFPCRGGDPWCLACALAWTSCPCRQ